MYNTGPSLQAVYDGLTIATFVLAATGFCFAVIGVKDARQAARIAWLYGNGARIIVAAGHVRQQGVAALLQFLLVAVAMVTWSLPDVPMTMPVGIMHVLVARKALRAMMSVLLISSSVLDWRDRRRIETMIKWEREH